MDSIVQDDGVSIAYLLDFWDDLDEAEKQRLYFYAKMNDPKIQQGVVSVTLLVATVIVTLGKGVFWPIINFFSWVAAH